jgi:DNA-binding Lrp family transcriptional regulator
MEEWVPINIKKMKVNKDMLLKELLINSNISDRKLAKKLGVSQPTISKMKKDLIENDLIEGFTVIPNFYKIGYKILAFTFVKSKTVFISKEETKKRLSIVKRWMMNNPNIVFCANSRGMNVDRVMVSFHKGYEEYDNFLQEHNQELGHSLENVKSLLVNLAGNRTIKPFHFKYLAEKSM